MKYYMIPSTKYYINKRRIKCLLLHPRYMGGVMCIRFGAVAELKSGERDQWIYIQRERERERERMGERMWIKREMQTEGWRRGGGIA